MLRWFMGILLFIAGLTLVFGFWLFGYHLTGKRAFTQWKAKRIAMGDHLDWKDLVPPSVPADRNFAEAPLIRGSIKEKGQAAPRFKALEIPKPVAEAMGNWQEGRKDDLEAIARAYGKANVLAVLKPMEGTLKELEEASQRPGCRFPIEYQEGEIPALLGFRSAVRTLRIRAVGNLRAGHLDQALDDVQTCFRMAEHLRAEPHLISALLRTAILSIAVHAVWEGLEEHRWTASQLDSIQQALSRIDLLATSRLAWQAERQGLIASWAAAADNQPPPKYWAEPGERRTQLGPLGTGWFYRNLLALCEFESSWVDAQDPVAHRVFPGKPIDPFVWLKRNRFRKDLIMAQIGLPALADQLPRLAKLQALIDEGMAVCALERYRIDKGRYPDHLETLTPDYLHSVPHDLVTGGSLHYSLRGGTFMLYQVGWDGKDEGGVAGWVGDGKDRKLDPAKGDWAWPHAIR